MLRSLLYTLSMDVKCAHFSDEQTVNNIKRGKRVKVLFARLDTESISTSNLEPNIDTKYVSYLTKHPRVFKIFNYFYQS